MYFVLSKIFRTIFFIGSINDLYKYQSSEMYQIESGEMLCKFLLHYTTITFITLYKRPSIYLRLALYLHIYVSLVLPKAIMQK